MCCIAEIVCHGLPPPLDDTNSNNHPFLTYTTSNPRVYSGNAATVDYPLGTIVYFQCSTLNDYRLIGDPVSVCQTHGTWTAPRTAAFPRCCQRNPTNPCSQDDPCYGSADITTTQQSNDN